MTRRFFGTEARYPHLVAEQGTKILGWASIGAYSERCAYADTGEVSVYISPDWKGRGIGSQLFEQLIAAGRAHSLHSLIARIGEGNPASLALHHRWGFEDMGFLPEIGFKFGRRLGVHILQLRLMIPTA